MHLQSVCSRRSLLRSELAWVGEAISRDDWHARWRQYDALERKAGLSLGLAIGFGCVCGYGYYLDWKVADQLKRLTGEKEEPAASK